MKARLTRGVGLAMAPLAVAAFVTALPAAAANYPASGRWAYVRGSAKPDCRRPPYMEFAGERRFDVGGSSVPEYRNLSVEAGAGDAYRLVDEFFNGQIRGQVRYTMRLTAPDRMTLHFEPAGRSVELRRCP